MRAPIHHRKSARRRDCDAHRRPAPLLTLAPARAIQADGDVKLEAINAGGMDAREANSDYYSNGCLGYYEGCGVASFTANQPLTDTANGGRMWSVSARGSITTGNLAVECVDFRTYGLHSIGPAVRWSITTWIDRDAGTVSLSAGSNYYDSYNNWPVLVTTGAIGLIRRPDTVQIAAGNDYYYYYNPIRGLVQTGSI